MKTRCLLFLLLAMLMAPLAVNAQHVVLDEPVISTCETTACEAIPCELEPTPPVAPIDNEVIPSEAPNFFIREGCAAPTNLTVSNITTSTATLNWNGDADSYDVRYGLFPASTSQEWLTYNVTYTNVSGYSTPVTTTRGVKYRADQITGNVLSKVEFYDNPTYNTGGYVTIKVYSGGDNAPGTLLYTETITPSASGLQTITLNTPVNIVRGENLWITLTETGQYTLYFGTCTDTDNMWMLSGTSWITWANGVNNNRGWVINGYMETVNYDNVSWTTGSCTENTYPLADLTDETVYVAQVRSNCGTETGVSEWTTTNFATPPCAMPAALTVSDITASTATLSWTGSSSGYDVRYGLYPTSSTSIGWLTYNVTQSGSVYGSSSESTKTRAVKYRADEITGNLLTKIEFYEVLSYNTGGYTIFSIYSGGENAPGTLLYTEEIHPDVSGLQTVTLAQPVNIVEGENLWITMTEYGTYTFGVGECTDNDNRWILNGTVWNTWTVADKGWIINGYLETMNYNAVTWTTYSCTENTFQLTGLTEVTHYLAQVRSRCGAGNGESVWATTDFMTTLPCAEPTDLEVSDITPESATLSWTGNANNYNVRYGLYEDGVSGQEWLTYNVTQSANYGSTTVYTRTRGVMYPAEQVTGNVLTKIEFYDNLTYNTGGNIIIRVYSGGEDAPGTLLYTETVVPTITGLQTVTLAEPVNILTGKNLWITFTETGTYTLSCGPCTDDNNRWYLNGSTWGPWTTGQNNGLGWIINAYMETVNLENINWTTASCSETTCPMTGLDPDSYYIAQVQSFCGDEGKSDWVSTYFTTEDGLFFVTDGNWNDGDNWYLGVVPPNGSSVVIKADAIIPAGYDAIVDNITLDGGSITIKDGGQLHSNVNIQATVEKEITGYTGEKDHYYLIANPLNASVNPANNGIASGTYDLYGFNGTLEQEEWRNYEAGAFNLTAGNGYLYANDNDITLEFTGTVRKQYNNLFYNGSALNYNETTLFGTWNLVGNMFPHNGYVYLGTIDGSSVVYADEMYYYKMNEDGDEVISTDGNEIVKPCEGIFVQSSEADQYAFFSSVKHIVNSKGLNMNLTRDGKLVDRAMLRFGNSHGLEKFQLNPNHSKVYLQKDGKDYAVMAAENQVGELPISFKAESNGSYTLSFNNEDVTFSYLHLIDNMTGIETDLLATPSYSFQAKSTDYANRFRLVFATGSSTDSDTFAFYSNGSFVINNEGQAMLQVIDVMGRIIRTETLNGCGNLNLDAAPGVYLLRLVNGDNVKVQKLVVR